MRQIEKYLLLTTLGFLLLLAVFAANALFLFRAGELLSVREMVERQQVHNAIVNPLYNRLLHVKHEAYRVREPEVVVVGTSRAMQFREYQFKRPFYNLAGVDGEPQQYLRSYQRLLRDQPPKLAIVVIDFWHYCDLGQVTSQASFTSTALPPLRQSSIVRLPIDLMMKGKLSFSSYLDLIATGANSDEGMQFIGIPASLEQHGFASDGSRYTLNSPFHERGSALSHRWTETLGRIDQGTANFRRNCGFDRKKVDRLLFSFVERLKRLGTEPVLVFAPLPDVTLAAMADYSDEFNYINKLRAYVKETADVPVFDYHRGSALGSANCEFRDGFHGGEVTYMRMLIDAAKRADSPLAEFVDLPSLEKAVRDHPGRLTIGSARIRSSMPAYFQREAGQEGCVTDESIR